MNSAPEQLRFESIPASQQPAMLGHFIGKRLSLPFERTYHSRRIP
jgi:hypothetical protein